ncbi:MAG: threonylcarbamoyl-AMP synthase [Dehalococcoidales bacterium]|nr:threonylcarbamoyl-AMP synthase [Dehalococcoidales bacterium]
MKLDSAKVKKSFEAGGVVVFPTDTVYGIGCVYDDEDAVKKIFVIKQRDSNKPLPLLLSSKEQLSLVTDDKNIYAETLADAFWPGALTLVVRKSKNVSDVITCGTATIAVRCPNNDGLRDLIGRLGKPIIGTSANISGEPSITKYSDAKRVFSDSVECVVEGRCTDNVPSTIVDVTGKVPKILREGPITAEQIKEVISRIKDKKASTKMKIAIGTDHRGFGLKEELVKYLKETGYEVLDCGPAEGVTVDYPVSVEKVAKAVQSGKVDRGILICGTGLGVSIAANKFKGIRAALCNSEFMAERCRLHNNANILCLGAEYDVDQKAIVKIFLTQEYEGGRHQKRLDMIASFES